MRRLAALLIALAAPALADSSLPPDPMSYTQLADPSAEARATALMTTIRCLVCQSQSIVDSNAEMAGDMRAMIRRRVAAGEQPDAIRTWLIERYGAWISYAPPVEPVTWPLWLAPLGFVGIGAAVARRRMKRR